jgi:hypothetical protein
MRRSVHAVAVAGLKSTVRIGVMVGDHHPD